MRILHVTAYSSVFSQGGTERYVDGLADGLAKGFGVDGHILAVTPKAVDMLPFNVTRLYPVSRAPEDMVVFRKQCKEFLERQHPDWMFIHTSDCMEAEVAKLAVGKKIPYIFFYHAPYWLCAHYDMQYCGRERCKRMFSPWRCSVCMASGKSGSSFRGAIGTLAGELQRLARLSCNSWLNSFRYELPRKEYIVRNASKVVVFTEQDKGIMLENGIEAERIAVIPQGVSEEQIPHFNRNAATERTGCLKVGYIGRAAKIKGCHILLEAMKLIPADVQLELHIYGCDESTVYVRQLHKIAGDDKRIVFHSMMPAKEVIKEYAKLDVLCIPSIVFETGPLTLFEGIYSGCRVYGSKQIGQMGMLLEYGRLVSENTASAWAEIFQDCAKTFSQLRASRRETYDYRTMSTISKELMNLCSGGADVSK